MAFLDSVKSTCEECSGKRFKYETLKYTLNGKSIVDVFEMTINQANDFLVILTYKVVCKY
jgi:excinuclease UvrABC ATPase subunit